MTERPLGQRVDFRSLVDHLDGVAIWFVAEPGEFEYISAGFEDIWGISSEVVVDDVERLVETIHPDDRDRVRSLIEQDPTDVTETTYESRVVRPGGTVRWTQTRQFPLRTGEGELEYVIGITTDITKQKRRQRELEMLNRLVRHDIRNDMSVVLGWLELLEPYIEDDGEEYLRKIQAASDHVVELTEIARDYVESLSDDEAMAVEPVPLHSTLQREIALCREAFPRAEFVVRDEIPVVEVVANEMLSSVFRNVLNNAIHHNDTDEPRVEIECETRGDDVFVSISDDGPGIADPKKDLVFDEDERGLTSSGAGVGLYLVKTLVTGYGGDVWIDDNDPRGATFTVRLRKA